jgi:hypothetical protein
MCRIVIISPFFDVSVGLETYLLYLTEYFQCECQKLLWRVPLNRAHLYNHGQLVVLYQAVSAAE